MVDGTIRIDTKINTKSAEEDLKQLYSDSVKQTKELERQFTQTEQTIAKTTGKIAEMEQQLKLLNLDSPKADKLALNMENAKQEVYYARQAQEELKGEIEQSRLKEQKYKKAIQDANKEQKSLNINTKGISGSVSDGISKILRYGMALISIRSIYGMLSNVANAWLNSNDEGARQLKADIDYMKYALGYTLSPVIQFIIGLLQQAFTLVASLVKIFTGTDILAESYASYMKSASKSAGATTKELQKQLASFDQINKMQSTSSGSGGGGGGSSATPNFMSLQDAMQEWENKLAQLKTDWEYYKDYFEVDTADGIEQIGRGILAGLGTVGEGVIDWIEDWTGVDLHDQVNSTFFGIKSMFKLGFGDIDGLSEEEISDLGDNISHYVALYLGKEDKECVGIGEFFVGWAKTMKGGWDLTNKENIADLINFATNLANLIEQLFPVIGKSMADDIRQGIDKAKGKIKTALENSVEEAGDNAQPIAEEKGIKIGEKQIEGVELGERSKQSSLNSTTNSVVNNANSNVNTSSFWNIGYNIISGIINGMNGNSWSLSNAISSIGNLILKGFKSVLGIHSPSREMMNLAKFIPLGIAEGIDATSEKAVDSMRSLADDLTETAEDITMPSLGMDAVNYIPKQSISTNAIQNAITGTNANSTNNDAIGNYNNRPIDVTLNLDGQTLLHQVLRLNDDYNLATNGGGL